MGVCNFLHVLCGVAYGAMTLYVQWQYIFLPINIFQLGFILSVLLTLAAGIFIPFFLIVFPRFLVRQGNKWSKFIIFMLISATCFMQVLFGATMIQGKNYSSEFVTSALKDQMTVSFKVQLIFFISHLWPRQISHL